jgi:hypothetical protein
LDVLFGGAGFSALKVSGTLTCEPAALGGNVIAWTTRPIQASTSLSKPTTVTCGDAKGLGIVNDIVVSPAIAGLLSSRFS